MTVFADTFGLIAWLNPRDNAHAVVAAYLDGFTGRLVTTEWVLMELADALSAPEARATVGAFRVCRTKDCKEKRRGRGQEARRGVSKLGGKRRERLWETSHARAAFGLLVASYPPARSPATRSLRVG